MLRAMATPAADEKNCDDQKRHETSLQRQDPGLKSQRSQAHLQVYWTDFQVKLKWLEIDAADHPKAQRNQKPRDQ